MIKQISTITILLLSISPFVNADFLLYLEEDRNDGSEVYCITDNYYVNNRIYYLQSDSTEYDNKRLSRYAKVDIRPGYILDLNGNCIIANINTSDYQTTNSLPMEYSNFSYLGLSLEHFNALMALSGIIISFIFLYGLTRFI